MPFCNLLVVNVLLYQLQTVFVCNCSKIAVAPKQGILTGFFQNGITILFSCITACCHISLFAELYFARHALLYYFPNVLSTPFLSFFIFIKKDINLALRLYKELNCVKIHVICSCYFNSQSVFLRSLTCRK